MMRRCVLGVAIAVLIAGGVTFAQQQGRTDKYDFNFSVPEQEMGPCGSAFVYATYEIEGKETSRSDKLDQPIQVITQYRTVKPTIYWLGTAGGDRVPGTRVAMGVAGEVEIDRLDVATGIVYAQGSIFQVTVPGHGRLFSETGHMALDSNSTTHPWTALLNRGHNEYWEKDLAALCNYLMGS